MSQHLFIKIVISLKRTVILLLLIFTLPINSQADRVTDHRTNLQEKIRQVERFKQWMIGANSSGVVDAIVAPSATPSLYPRSYYNLKGMRNKKFLQYESQGTGRGINIGWTNNASAGTAKKVSLWMFVPRDLMKRAGRADRAAAIRQIPIRYGEKIAIAWRFPRRNWSVWIKTGKWNFIKYTQRNVGINLDWSNEPVYEWAILGGKPGTQVKKGKDRVVIYNIACKQPLIYYPRTLGGHIGWPDSNAVGGPVREKKKPVGQEVWNKLMM